MRYVYAYIAVGLLVDVWFLWDTRRIKMEWWVRPLVVATHPFLWPVEFIHQMKTLWRARK